MQNVVIVSKLLLYKIIDYIGLPQIFFGDIYLMYSIFLYIIEEKKKLKNKKKLSFIAMY